MDDALPARRVIPYRLTAAVAEKRIKELAKDSGNVAWSYHALSRMDEREIFDSDVLRILRGGMIAGRPEETPRGEWKCKIILRLRGTREAGVVAVILKKGAF